MTHATDSTVMADRTSISVTEKLADELYSRKNRGDSYEDVIWQLIEEADADKIKDPVVENTDAENGADKDTKDNYRTFSLSTIKNYIGGAVAVAAAEKTDANVDEIIHEHLTSMDAEVRNGAEELGLLNGDHQLTDRGRDVITAYIKQFGDLDSVLKHFDEVGNSRGRYVEKYPAMADVVRDVFIQYGLVSVAVGILGDNSVTLDDFTRQAWEKDPDYVKDVILRETEDVRSRVYTDNGLANLDDPHIYRSTTAHKIKTLGYHAGVFTTTGDVPDQLSPTEQVWKIDTRTSDDYCSLAADDNSNNAENEL